MRSHSQIVPIDHLEVKAYTVPTDSPESDGTLEWGHTTPVLVLAGGGGKQSIGYTYAGSATATLIHEILSPILKGLDAMSPTAAYMAMWRHLRNLGRPGICSMAISAVDCALWDLKARLLNLQQRAEIMKRIGTVKQTISGLANLFGDGVLNEELIPTRRTSRSGSAPAAGCRTTTATATSPHILLTMPIT